MRREKGLAKNMEVVAYHDLEDRPGFQMALQVVGGRSYLYLAHWWHPGWTIMDVTEASKPKLVKFVPDPGGKPGTSTPKIQVANGIMITTMQQKPEGIFGYPPDTPFDEGFYVWDVKDPENPKLLGHWKTGLTGTHRSYYDGGRYVHLSASCPGFYGNIYRVVDIYDPTHPIEVGRWWLPEQWLDGGGPVPKGWLGVHGPPYPKGDKVYISYAGIGMVILDIADITRPKFLGKLQINPPFGAFAPSCHTVIPFSQRPLAIVTSEGSRVAFASKERLRGIVPGMNLFGIADISDVTNPVLIAIFPYPEIPEGFAYKNFSEIEGVGPFGFGVHNVHEPHYHPDLEDRNDRIYCCYFSAGVRVYDVSDPYVPREIAYYLPPDPKKWTWNRVGADPFPGPLMSTTEDIVVDKRGYIYIDTMQQGLYILRCTV